ncbi:MAG: transglutaminase domain protein, partial [Solirubrobacterales bacterium]|nr:transglutaminase domain protein [Solirubrobacterales bacterium]
SANVADDPWPLATALLLAGAVWMAAAALAAPPTPSGRRTSVFFALAAVPWILALTRGRANAPIWEGALVLLAGLLLWLSSRVAAAPAVALSVAVALVSAATAQAVAPRGRWLGFPGDGRGPPSFSTLNIEPTFGPLPDRRRGRSMLEIRAAQPALWRMQALDVFDWFGWRVDRTSDQVLPQPAARPVWTDVRVRGLQNDLAVAPGRIERVVGRNPRRVAGEAWRLTPPPRQGDHYRVRADVVRARADQLRRAPAPSDPRLRRYTRVGWLPPGLEVPLFGQPRNPGITRTLARTPYRRIGVLARRLSAGATTEWDVVARVQHYLRDSGRFRYTTDVPAPGPLPLVDFLLRDHAGYCQHFAGAAALLLRLAGVPARVVAGFATGAPESAGRFDVRDLDAHDWIEVYFQGYGWVPFNPTPAAAPADVPRALDLLAPASTGATGGGWPSRTVAALLAALVLVGITAARRGRRGERAGGDLLVWLARRAGAHVEESSTLGELREELAVRLGPHTSALAAAAERVRYAELVPSSVRPTRPQIVRALVSDIGVARAALLLVQPVARDPSRRRA